MTSPTRLSLVALAAALPAQVPDYWHEGKAEVCRYDLEFSRYGEVRSGYAVLVFVTEDFRTDLQVKDEHGGRADSVNVLKVNRIERFTTGIYDYSLMASTFTAMDTDGSDLPPTFKTTASIQDWCGQVWLQSNRRADTIEVVGHSYFEAEADERFQLPQVLLEDEVLAQVRLRPHRLPLGRVQVIPSAFRSRLDHRRPAVAAATASLVDRERTPTDDVAQSEYRLAIEQEAGAVRTLSVRFNKGYPFHVTRFEETLTKGGETTLLSRAVLQRTLRVAYWQKNGTGDDGLRADLGLGPAK